MTDATDTRELEELPTRRLASGTANLPLSTFLRRYNHVLYYHGAGVVGTARK